MERRIVKRRIHDGLRGFQSGASIVEVLVTLILVSVGLLGIAGMQLATVQTTNSAAQRFEATTLAKDILERMRANRNRAMAGQYDIAIGASATGGTLADEDLQEWKAALSQALPGGDGAVDVQAVGTSRVATITVQWTDAVTEDPSAATVSSVFLRTDL